MKWRKLMFEDKLLRVALIIALVPTFCFFTLLYFFEISLYLKILIVFFTLVGELYGAFFIRAKVVSQLQTSTNLMEAMIAGDYSMRARAHHVKGALGEFSHLINSLAETLTQHRLITREHQILLATVTSQIDVAIIALNSDEKITLMNPAAEKLFQCRFEQRQGAPIKELGLQEVARGAFRKVVEFELKHNKKKVYLHTDEYFDHGVKHQLIFITDIQHLLQEEERQAWQRLLRVLSHEINNSLAPIASISETLSNLVAKNIELHSENIQRDNNNSSNNNNDDNLNENLIMGLGVIKECSHSLNTFIQQYQELYKLPKPCKSLFSLTKLLNNCAGLFTDNSIECPNKELTIYADQTQLQQVLVNLLKNAIDAQKGFSNDTIIIKWQAVAGQLAIEVVDNGTGINNMDNMFVPFYTTKKHGSGIGLVLSRQIITNHNGELLLTNRSDSQGVVAKVLLPHSTDT
jgi:nitrogen fixation/metabolism regulation signal transduction histidine kinase